MKEYPKGFLIKQDYVNLLSMPEYAKQAKEDLARLAAIDDAKVTMEQGTEDSPNPVEIDNPMPMWKRAGFTDKDELLKLAETGKMASIADIRSIINAKDGTTEGDAVELSEDLVEAEKAKKEKKVVKVSKKTIK